MYIYMYYIFKKLHMSSLLYMYILHAYLHLQMYRSCLFTCALSGLNVYVYVYMYIVTKFAHLNCLYE